MKGVWKAAVVLSTLIVGSSVFAGPAKTIDVFKVNDDPATHGISEKIGTITFEDSEKGLIVTPHIKGLTPGEHGFHIHENPSCEATEFEGKLTAGMGAGEHFDPNHSGSHKGPHGAGHLGDLPVLVVDSKGETPNSVIAPRLSLSAIENHSVIIHVAGDNYSDNPPMGGSGERIACGVIK